MRPRGGTRSLRRTGCAARLFASLDHLSKGRAGWNIVTTGAERAAQNFRLDEHPPHIERYARADEFVRVVGKLWDSWKDGAVVADGGSGLFADTSRIHPIGHEGKYFRVAGPLNTPRSPAMRAAAASWCSTSSAART